MLGPKCDQQSWEVTTLTAHYHPPRPPGRCCPPGPGLRAHALQGCQDCGVSLPQLHPGFPGKSFWLEGVFGATEMTATRLAASGRSLHMKGSTNPATNTLSSV